MLVDKILSELKTTELCAIPEKVFDQLRSSRSFAIWGTGRSAKYAITHCAERGLKPVCVCDSFPHGDEEMFGEFPLVSSDVFFSQYNECTVLICCASEFGIADILRKKVISFLEWDTYFLLTEFSEYPLIEQMKKYKTDIDAVYNMLADEKSKLTYENVFKYRLTADMNYINAIHDSKVYFGNDVVPSVDVDAFVDCGAYVGDTLSDFVNFPSCKCKVYYALEPDPQNYSRLAQCVSQSNLDNLVKLYQIAVYSEKSTINFQAVGSPGSRISQEGTVSVNADSIDNIVSSDSIVGYIKMDIEGGEIPALNGARNTILRDNPILGVSIYHRQEDLWEIPLLIKEINKNYKLYIRHHCLNIGDTVCYATNNLTRRR